MTPFSSALLALSLVAGCCPTAIDALPASVMDGFFDNPDDQMNLLQTEVVTKSLATQPHGDKLEQASHACKSFVDSKTAYDFHATAAEDEAPNEAAECIQILGITCVIRLHIQVTEMMGTRAFRRQS